MNPYETERLLSEYLLFHYGREEEIFDGKLCGVPETFLHFPARVAACCAELSPGGGRALDLGCAVGRSSFELARRFDEVIGIDFSAQFIEAATALQRDGFLPYNRLDEGLLCTPLIARVPGELDRARVHFKKGDAQSLPERLGKFDLVLAANLLCRLRQPRKLLQRLPTLVQRRGQLILATPCTWLEEFTPAAEWIGGVEASTLDGLKQHLLPHFELLSTVDLPFLIREHRRKFQLSVSLVSCWRRR